MPHSLSWPKQGLCLSPSPHPPLSPRAITVRVPMPSAGVVDIPIMEKEVKGQQHHKVGEPRPVSPSSPPEGQGQVCCLSVRITSGFLHLQMALSPSYRMDNGKMVRVRTNRSAHVAVTQYQVLSSTVSCALLELQPVTGEGATTPWPAGCPVLLGSAPLSSWYGGGGTAADLLERLGAPRGRIVKNSRELSGQWGSVVECQPVSQEIRV